jgi:integrase
MEALLRQMQKRATSYLLFPSPFAPEKVRDASAIRHRLTAACKVLDLPHATPHGLRSYFVTRARESGLSDAEIALLIGDKTGPAIISHTYGDIRPEHLLTQAQRIRLTTTADRPEIGEASSIKTSNRVLPVSPGFIVAHESSYTRQSQVVQ